jgi:hypothetical protein
MTPDKPVRLTVSAIRQRIFEVSGVPSQGAGSAAGQLFHRVAEQALDEAHPAYWRSVLTGELNADEWLGALYQHSLGPELTRQHALLRESGEEVLTLWRGVQSFARWFCGILSEAVRTGVLHFDGQAEQWVGGDSLFQSECELETVFFLPDWTRPVVVSGRLDQVIRIAPDRCCVVEPMPPRLVSIANCSAEIAVQRQSFALEASPRPMKFCWPRHRFNRRGRRSWR